MPRQRNYEKAKNFKGTWKKLFSYNKKYILPIIIAVICAAIGTVFTIVGPNKLSDMTDVIADGLKNSMIPGMTGGIDLDKIFNIGILLVILYGSSTVLGVIQNIIMAIVTAGVTKNLRNGISVKINTLPMWYYNKASTGDVLSRVTNDIDTIAMSFNQSIGMLVTSVSLLAGSLIMMLITNGWMTLTAVFATIIGFIFMTIITSRSQKYFNAQQHWLGEINGHVEEVFSGHTVIKAYNAEKIERKKFDKMNENLRKSAFKAQVMSGLMMPLMTFIGNLGFVAVCVVGAVLVMNGSISFGVIVAFMIYVRLFTQPLSQIAQAIQSLQSAAAAGERVFEFIEAPDMEDESEKNTKIENVRGEVEFSHVKFGYEDSDKIVINDFSAKAKPGQKIAIVGPTGAGKTTLVNLLMRFHELKGGDIKIDGVSIKDLTREQVHSLFCMVLQDTWLFCGTIRENLVYNDGDVADEELDRACRAVGIYHFIKNLPNGYDTVLDEQTSLSQGQKQQLTIARAMIENRPMLILDEATSSVDTRTEIKIQQAMDKLMHGRTSFIIAHRLSTIKNADLILVLNNGDVIESGNHETLMKKGGFYADLYNSQFESA